MRKRSVRMRLSHQSANDFEQQWRYGSRHRRHLTRTSNIYLIHCLLNALQTCIALQGAHDRNRYIADLTGSRKSRS